MARRGFFGRIRQVVERVREVFAPSPPPEREQPRERPAPPRFDPYRREWRDQHGGDNYQKHLDVFHANIDPIEDDEDERLMLWESYIKYMVKGEGRFRRNDSQNIFWRDSGIDPQNFKWDRWREAMGYIGDRRSRTP